MHALLTRLVRGLLQTGLDDINAEELAEVIWFAAYLNKGNLLAQQSPAREEPEEITQPFSTRQKNKKTETQQPEPQITAGSTTGLFTPDSKSQTGQSGVSFHTPAGQALPNSLNLLRTLRPLRRRIPSSTILKIDEEATAQQIAETGAWLPVLKPQPVRWLELALVVDESPSMQVWVRTITEFRRLLEQLGAFRDIRQWVLKTGGRTQKVALHNHDSGLPRHYKELINPAQTRLIMLVSDCVSPAWQSQELLDWLAAWGQRHPVVLFQMLPQNLWPQTRLQSSILVKATSPGPAASNHALHWQIPRLPWQAMPEQQQGVPLPVTTFDPESLATWLRFLTGAQRVAMPAFIGTVQALSEPKVLHTPEDEAERLQQFRQTASPEAFRLACCCAAAPLRLPIMRLVQQVMLPNSHQTHLAEFYLSGLIRRISPPEVIDPDEIDYDFIGGLREKMLHFSLQSEAFHVQEMVSDYIQEHYGRTNDFRAVLAADVTTTANMQVEATGHQYFARVSETVLKKMGGQYATLKRNQSTVVSDAEKFVSDKSGMIGKTLRNLQIVSELGRGGMGVVYLAEHLQSRKKVAVKSFFPELIRDPLFRERINRGVKILARLYHPYIIQYTDLFEESGQLFLVMEYVEGKELSSLIKQKGKLSEEEALPIIRDILSGLGFAHSEGIIHRDMKPSNVMVGNDGRTRIMDFGIAFTEWEKRSIVRSYTSPEQIRHPEDIDHRSDIYSVGIIMFEMLTGDVPFDGDRVSNVLERQLNAPASEPVERNPEIAAALSKIILKAMEKRPEQRYQSCEEFLQSIITLQNS